jgi:hypothetical protein
MLMLDRRMLLRASSAAVGAAALDPATPALAYAAWRTLCRALNDDTRSNIPASGAMPRRPRRVTRNSQLNSYDEGRGS